MLCRTIDVGPGDVFHGFVQYDDRDGHLDYGYPFGRAQRADAEHSL